MHDDTATPSFLGGGLFRIISVLIFLGMVAAIFAVNPGGGAAQGPLRLRVAAPVEAADWVSAAAEAFNASNQKAGGQSITVYVDAFASDSEALDAARQSLNGADPYSVVITTGAQNAGSAGFLDTTPDFAPAPVATTYVIGVVRQDYAEPLAQQLGRTELSLADLEALFDPSTPPDSPVFQVKSGRPTWGATSTDGTFDGAAAVYVLAQSFHKAAAPRFSDPALEAWLKNFYAAASQSRGSFYLVGADMVKYGRTGPSAAILSEAVALRTAESLRTRGQALQLLYPSASVQVAIQYGIVGGSFSERQRQAGAKFRQYLLGDEQQARASAFGLRRADGSVATTSGDSLWQKLPAAGAKPGYRPSQVVRPGDGLWAEAEQLAKRVLTK